MPGMYHVYCVQCDLWAPHRFAGREAARQALKDRLDHVGGDPWFRPHSRHVLTLWHFSPPLPSPRPRGGLLWPAAENEYIVGRSVPTCLDPLCYCAQDKLWHTPDAGVIETDEEVTSAKLEGDE